MPGVPGVPGVPASGGLVDGGQNSGAVLEVHGVCVVVPQRHFMRPCTTYRNKTGAKRAGFHEVCADGSG